MKTNYYDFISDYFELKKLAIKMSHELSKFNRTITDFTKFDVNDIYHEVDDCYYKDNSPHLVITTTINESCGCCYSDINFNVPLYVLFTEKNFNEYIKNEKNRIEQENIKIQKQKEEEKIKKEKEKLIYNKKLIQKEKEQLMELIKKYPDIVKKNNTK